MRTGRVNYPNIIKEKKHTGRKTHSTALKLKEEKSKQRQNSISKSVKHCVAISSLGITPVGNKNKVLYH